MSVNEIKKLPREALSLNLHIGGSIETLALGNVDPNAQIPMDLFNEISTLPKNFQVLEWVVIHYKLM